MDKSSTNESSKFNTDPNVLKHASYGQVGDPAKALEARLKA